MNVIIKSVLLTSLLTCSLSVFASQGFSTSQLAYKVPKNVQTLCQKHIQKLPKSEQADYQDGCMQVDIQLLNSSYNTLNKAVNGNFHLGNTSTLDENAQEVYETLQYETLNQLMLFSITSEPKLISQSNKLWQISRDEYLYTGGSRGSDSKTFYVYDIKQDKVLTIDDILMTPTQKSKLTQLAKTAYLNYLKAKYDEIMRTDSSVDTTTKQMIAEHIRSWKFYLTNNFYFTPDGITLTYQLYELGPYMMGLINLNIDKQALQGIIKTEYLSDPLGGFDDDGWHQDKDN